jgi:hypothetical protein
MMATAAANHSMEPTGASRSGQLQFVRQRRLAPAAHAGRSLQFMPRCIFIVVFGSLVLACSGCATTDPPPYDGKYNGPYLLQPGWYGTWSVGR